MAKRGATRMLLLTVLGAIIASPLTAEPPAVFVPSTPWSVAGEDGRCRLSRMLSDGHKSVELTVEATPLTLSLSVSLRDTDRAGKYVLANTDMRFDDAAPPVRERMIESFDSTDGVHRVHSTSLRREELTRVAADGSLTLAPDGQNYITLQLPNLAGALSVLDHCENIVMADAGLPVDQFRAIKTMAWPIVHGVAKPPAFITHADKGDLEDMALASVLISPAGIPTACNMLHRAKSAELDGDLCTEALARKYDPARDAAGHPVPGIYFAVRRWQRFMKERGQGDEYFTP